MRKEIIELREVVQKLVPLLTDKGLVVTQRGSQAYVKTNAVTLKPTQVNIPNVSENASPEFIRAIGGFIDHEVAHVLITDWTVYGGAPDPADLEKPEVKKLLNIHNIIEDTMIEREIVKIFPGSKRNIADLREHFIRKITTEAMKRAKSPEEQFNYLLVPVMRALAGHTEFQEYMDDNDYWSLPMIEKLVGAFTPASLELLKTCSSTAETLVIAEELYDILYRKPPESEKGPSQDKPNQKAGEGDGDGERDHSGTEEVDETEDEGGGEADGSDQSNGEAEGEDDAGTGDADETKEASGSADDDDADEDAGDSEDDGADGDDGENADADDDAHGDVDDGDEKGDGSESGGEDTGDSDGGSKDDEDKDDAGSGSDDGSNDGSNDGDDDADGADTGDDDDGDEFGSSAADTGVDDEDDEDDGDDDGAAGMSDGDCDGPTVKTDGATDESETEAPTFSEDESDGGNGVGTQEGKSMFELDEDALDGRSISDEMQILISQEAVESLQHSEWTVFTREWDQIKHLEVPEKMNGKWVPEMEEEVRAMTGRMQKDIERIMASQSHVIRTPGHKNGKLHAASLYRVSQGDPRVFTQRQEHVSKDTAVMLLIDNSGSMYGAKMRTAMMGGYALSATLDRVGIAHEMIGFTTGGYGDMPESLREAFNEEYHQSDVNWGRTTPIVMPIYKDFSERLDATVKRRVAYAMNAQRNLNGNIDGESLMIAAERLAVRPEKRKVMLVLSDGQPAGGINSDRHLKGVVEYLEKSAIECVGIGIMSKAVARYYNNHVILNDLDDLPGQVMTEIKNILN